MCLQVYKGLSIATAKATNDEQKQATHHLLDVATPHEPFTVTHFRDKALPIVSNSVHKFLVRRLLKLKFLAGSSYFLKNYRCFIFVK